MTPYIHPDYKPSLSRREVALLAGWERERRGHVTAEYVRTVAGRAAAKDIVKSLVGKGALVRLSRGLYLVRPFRSLLRPTVPSAPVALAAFLHDEPYFVGGLWAFAHHGFTDQQYASTLDAFVTRVRPSRTMAGARVVFHALPLRSMEHGISETTIEGVAIRVSDPERTLVDVLDHPRMVGGLGRAVELFASGLARVRIRKVAEYAARFSRTSTCQRLGLMLERAHAPASALRHLDRRVQGSLSSISMLPGRRTGHVNRRWNVVENDRALDATPSS